MSELKAYAITIGIDTKGLLKAQLCQAIQDQSKSTKVKTPIKAKSPIQSKSPIKSKSPIQSKSPIKTKIPLKTKIDKTKASVDTDCPLNLQPNNGVCPDQYPFQFQTQSGLPCCYKQPKPKSTGLISKQLQTPLDQWVKNAISIVATKKTQPTGVFPQLNSDYYVSMILDYHQKTPKESFYNKGYKLYEMYLKKSLFMPCQDLFCVNFPNHADCQNLYQQLRRVYFLIETFNRSINIQNLSDEMACQLYLDQLPSSEWIQAQVKYMNQLSSTQKQIVVLYSNHGDAVMNSYLRNNHHLPFMDGIMKLKFPGKFDSFKPTLQAFLNQDNLTALDPILTDQNIDQYCEYLVTQLNEIISGAPQTDKEFQVLRGIKENYYLNGTTDIYANKGFVSTSLRSIIALRFAKADLADQFHYMNMITIPKGYSCLLNTGSVYAAEFEVILPDQSKYIITSQFQAKNYIVDDVLVNSNSGNPGQKARVVTIPTNQVKII